MKELEDLLEEYWIIKEQDKDKYYRIRDSLPEFKNFISDKLGYQVIITPDLIKLEKLPGKAESWMGIEGFDDQMEYGFLCILLAFLEDKGKEDQFLLSQLTEFIQGLYPGEEKIDWTIYSHRRHLIKVIRFALDNRLIKVDDGDDSSFYNDESTEVLYENTGYSKYFMRHFTGNLLSYNNLEDIENDEWIDLDTDRGRIRRNRVYRRIVMSPALYREEDDDQDYLYVKNYRGMLQADIEKYLELDLHVHKNGTFLIVDKDKKYKHTFPESKSISDIALQVNKLIVDRIKDGIYKRDGLDIIQIPKHSFEGMLKEIRNDFAEGWSKEYREMRLEKLVEHIISYMKDFRMIEEKKEDQEIVILPLVGKIVGEYPKDFLK